MNHVSRYRSLGYPALYKSLYQYFPCSDIFVLRLRKEGHGGFSLVPVRSMGFFRLRCYLRTNYLKAVPPLCIIVFFLLFPLRNILFFSHEYILLNHASSVAVHVPDRYRAQSLRHVSTSPVGCLRRNLPPHVLVPLRFARRHVLRVPCPPCS